MRLETVTGIVLGASISAATWAISGLTTAKAQEASEAASPPAVTQDDYQRSAEIFAMNTVATSGPARGEAIYYYKCWFCHNQYARTGPGLEDMYERPALLSGQPVNDQTVVEQILNGSPGVMPAYRDSLTEADMADLLSYIKSDGCCFDSEEPPPNPRYRAERSSAAQPPAAQLPAAHLRGGPFGVVRTVTGDPLEGIGAQLISDRTAIRTTVYTNETGQYEFPVLEEGTYTLRIARPLEFKPYVQESVQIQGRTDLPEIALERVSDGEFIPSTPEVVAQLSGVEWLMNLPGTAQEKKLFSNLCTHCHSYQQIFRNRFNEDDWLLIVSRMQRAGGSPLVNWDPNEPPNANDRILAGWLARIRGPESEYPQGLITLPWPQGRATRVVITEYEMKRRLLAPHDVHGDSQGNIWYTAHRTPYSGMLDPQTGTITEYRIPATREEDTEGAVPGTHRLWVDQNDIVWFSEQWDHFLTGLDARTGETVKRFGFPSHYRLNSSGFSNFAMDEAGYVYETNIHREMIRIDTRTGEVKPYPFPEQVSGVYDNVISPDGRYWVGGQGNRLGLWDTKSEEYWEYQTRSPYINFSRGGFDRQGVAWFGGRGSGILVSLDTNNRRMREYFPPIPYPTVYEAQADKNGEIWVAPIQAGRFLRFNPRTEQWIAYPTPEPYSHNRRAWIDNSTDPVTVWWVDHNGWIVRMQPLD